MSTRTTQDLLAERRSTVLELSRERDETARFILKNAIDLIDAELARRRKAA